MNFRDYIKQSIISTINEWDETDIFAISILVHVNEDSVYKGKKNFPEVCLSYNTEEDCEHAPEYSEERWNYAYWEEDETFIISPDEKEEGAEALWKWYQDENILLTGEEEDGSEMYDEEMQYIGKGPVGYYELLCLISDIVRELQQSGIIRERFGRIPVLVHDFEECWYTIEATQNANPDGEADTCIRFWKEEG